MVYYINYKTKGALFLLRIYAISDIHIDYKLNFPSLKAGLNIDKLIPSSA